MGHPTCSCRAALLGDIPESIDEKAACSLSPSDGGLPGVRPLERTPAIPSRVLSAISRRSKWVWLRTRGKSALPPLMVVSSFSYSDTMPIPLLFSWSTVSISSATIGRGGPSAPRTGCRPRGHSQAGSKTGSLKLPAADHVLKNANCAGDLDVPALTGQILITGRHPGVAQYSMFLCA